ncbi:MAG: sigma-70 family RNA polymerase sigma factor [Cognatishimia sp.]|uniref:sigma-70 family RNA polymerase sigma factor n=1 Tax=Cognatishimia sp. TaxID=2211648 RepID=UPI0040596E86
MMRISCMLTFEQTVQTDRDRSDIAGVHLAASSSESKGVRDTYSDQTQWMLAVRDQRDKAAFSRLFDHYAPRLKGFVMRSGTGNAQAEEIVQDVMLTVWRKAHLFDPHRAQVSSWIYQVARNRQIDVIRRDSRPIPEELNTPESTDEDAPQIIALDQEAQVLRQALARLKPGQREMLEKAYLGDLTHAEIKAQTGLPLGTIKSRIRLGLEKLRHELKDLRS